MLSMAPIGSTRVGRGVPRRNQGLPDDHHIGGGVDGRYRLWSLGFLWCSTGYAPVYTELSIGCIH